MIPGLIPQSYSVLLKERLVIQRKAGNIVLFIQGTGAAAGKIGLDETLYVNLQESPVLYINLQELHELYVNLSEEE